MKCLDLSATEKLSKHDSEPYLSVEKMTMQQIFRLLLKKFERSKCDTCENRM